MSLSILKEQKHGVEVPVMLPFYNYVKLSSMGSTSVYTLSDNNYSDEIRWELSGDNIINLAKSYIQFDIDAAKDAVVAGTDLKPNAVLYPKYIKGIKEGFGFATFRICNQTGNDLVKLDDSYEPYRVFIDELVRKRPDIFYQDNYYDGIKLKWDDSVHENIIEDLNEWEMDKDGRTLVELVKAGSGIALGKFYNTFAALKSDVFNNTTSDDSTSDDDESSSADDDEL